MSASQQPSDTIKKERLGLTSPPNLLDYDEVASRFSWEDVKKELSWFPDGSFNAAYNAVDRHIGTPIEHKVAIFWEDEKGSTRTCTYGQLTSLSNQYASYLSSRGVARFDRVFLFLPRIIDLYAAFLGTLKLGAIAGTLFSAFGQQAIFDRLGNSGAKALLTTQELLPRVEPIRSGLTTLSIIDVVDTLEFQKAIASQPTTFDVVHTKPQDYAFMLYTSGTTGKPKGVVHTHQAILQQYQTARWVLDLMSKDVYWCTADPGWVTGIAYGILGSLACGVSQVVYSGRFDPEKWYTILEKYRVNVWYTAPTAIRMLMAKGDALVKQHNLANLRYMASVGEPLNPEAIRWGMSVFGKPFHDNWWQTETGSIMIANYPSMDIKVGSMGKPIPGTMAAIVDDNGELVPDGEEGNLAIKPGWPSQMATIWQNQEKYNSYFVKSWYISGDRAWRDHDGYYWFLGRADDVIKSSGERIGPFEVESALVAYPSVIEAGVIGKPDPVRGEIVKAFVVVKPEVASKLTDESFRQKLTEELQSYVKTHLAGHAYPREIEFIDKLPKTRSGKIMRRILKAKEMGQPIGDTSTLEEY